MEEISLNDILDMLKDNWKFIAIFTATLVVICAIFTTFFIDKEYSSSITLIVGKPAGYADSAGTNSTYNEVLTNQKLVGTYSEIAKSNTIMNEVIKNLGLSMTGTKLASMIEVSTVNDTELISMTVTDKDPVEAATIANETANVFMDNIGELMKIDNLQVVDPAEVNSAPVSPSLKLNLAIAFLLGIVLSVFVIFLKEMLDTRIKSVDELKELMEEIPIVAIIPQSDALLVKSEGRNN